jgi:Tol biopolymer transport system component
MNGLANLRYVGLLLGTVLVVVATACGSSSSDLTVFVSSVDGDQEIYLLDPDNGEVTRLTDNLVNDFNPRVSPDGNSIVYLSDESGDLEINLVDRKGESITRLTHNLGDDRDPAWSPDGRRIAFVSEQDENPEVYLMAGDGSGQTRVTSNSVADRMGDWSPDGEWLVLYRSEDETEQGLWLRNPDGVNLVPLTTEQDSSPAWAPSGQSIAFVRTNLGNADIYIVRKLKDGTWQDDTELTRLTQHESDDLSPVWSPDSKTIAFVSYRDGNAEIYTMLEDGSKQRRLTNNEADDIGPVWSPDGKRMAFVSYLYGPGEIFLMGADGATQWRVTNNDAEEHSPDW